ncbi:arginyl-tRNA ligase [Hyphomicrobium denitrificans 1NES1]|uniref:Arginine--tRNA ligase n=1 Tax=Hyphomicrobium denitrificans 1NES1 TaxID=670307 RepID=N0B246_9HYPH|nr:arginine--tRNA ligase [Hyphomicrobium denitrificans]AGK57539.1 arginyl-tRNA ligase [Hyphomicrobium denitrificans 1NES1]
MNVFTEVEARVRTALEALKAEGTLPADLALPAFEAEPPRDASHGDIAVNAALVLAKAAKMKPRDIAETLKAKLEAHADIQKIEVAGPGFLNITFKTDVWHDLVRDILSEGERYGAGSARGDGKLNIEYVSANPTGPMHVGHCRGAVFGDALANLLAFAGYDVTREYYINDAGGQVNVLARSAYLRYREALGEDIGAVPEGLYPGDYLKPVGEALAKEHGPSLLNMSEERWLPVVRSFAIEKMMAMIKEDLAALNIRHDVFFSEASLQANGKDQIKAVIEELRKKGLIYEGKLDKPKGHDDGDWEDRLQTLFKSTAFGDDEDRALQKSDGSYTYFAGDVAYHHDKLSRGFRHLINVFGADHVGYIPRIKAVVAALSDKKADLDVKVVQLVRLFKAGEPYKMSKRAGTFVTLRDVVDEVGRDPVRYMMLYRKNQETLDFDFAKVTEQSKDNPVFYVQYAHARSASVLRNAVEQIPDLDVSAGALRKADLSLLTDPGEIDLIKRLASFPRLIDGAASAHEPHRLAFYLYDLASALHSQWTRGNDSPHLRFIQSNDGVATSARLALIAATKTVIKSGLDILGVEAPDAMR